MLGLFARCPSLIRGIWEDWVEEWSEGTSSGGPEGDLDKLAPYF